MNPTKEQQAVIEAPKGNLKVVAYAGTGKTSTFVARAQAAPQRTLYLAFNKSVAEEAKKRFPATVTSKTQHSLAYHAILGKTAKYALGKLSVFKTAGHFKIDYYLASLVHKTLEFWANSADPEINLSHAAPDFIDRYTEDMSAIEVDMARKVWSLILDGRDRDFPMTHYAYLKMYQLSKPRLNYDLIMLDEAQDCQPPGTKVTMVDGSTLDVEKIRVGDKVISYDGSGLRLRKQGSTVISASSHRHVGTLVKAVTSSGKEFLGTPGHICVAKIGPALKGKSILYLMRKNDYWRIGITSANHGKNGRESGLAGRLREERADAIYILAIFGDRRTARNAEMEVSAVFSIPEIRFCTNSSRDYITQSELDQIWFKIGNISDRAEKCLEFYGRDIRYPIATRKFTETGNRSDYLLYTRASTIRACNLLTGMEFIDSESLLNGANTIVHRSNQVHRNGTCWSPIEVSRVSYDGWVYSIEVARDHTYISNGIVTHNCNPVTQDIIMSQAQYGTNIFLAGDAYQQIYRWRGAVDALQKIDAPPYYLTQSFRFGPEIAGVANTLLGTFFGEKRLLTGLGQPGHILGLEEKMPSTPYTYLSRTNAFLFAYACGLAGKFKLYTPGAGTTGNLPLFDSVMNVFHLWKGNKFEIRDPELRLFQDYWEFKEFCDTGNADAEYMVSRAIVDKYQDSVPSQIEQVRKSLVPYQEDADITLVTAHRAKGLEWDNVILCDDFPELYNVETGTLKEVGIGNRDTQIAPDEINLL
jgi:hypothetical protein